MSFEQKYLKYKQKYQELKRQLGGGDAHKLETENYGEDEFVLTETPTFQNQQVAQKGGNVEQELEYDLTETPTFQNQQGGATIMPADFALPIPLESCAGQVNPQPIVDFPVIQPPPPMPFPQTAGGDDLNTTTDLSEIQNTEDIEKLFNQFGGKQDSSSSSSSSDESSESSSSTASSDTISDL